MIDSKVCPLCKKSNKCEADIPKNNCWCNNTFIPKEIREYIPDEYKMKACICKECVSLFISNKDEFISKYNKNH